jgi:hypothetical protein
MCSRRFVWSLLDPEYDRTTLRVRESDHLRENLIACVIADVAPGEPRMLTATSVRKRFFEFDFIALGPSLGR